MAIYPEKYQITDWMPITAKELKFHAWEQPDIILFTGDAYIDHPSFGIAVIARVLEKHSYKVAIVPQPNWKDDLRDFKKFGKPRLFFGVSAGNMDSMINHYTANKRLRSNDAYTPDGRAGQRPDYALTVYSNILKDLYPDVPLVIGGIEASLRRLTHYDYWQNKLKPSVLFDTKADILLYGMAEKSIVKVADLLNKGVNIKEIKNLQQTAVIVKKPERNDNVIEINSHKECLQDKLKFAKNFKTIEVESNSLQAKTIIQNNGDGNFIVVNPPYPPLSEKEMDANYDLPFTRLPHPKYWKKGNIPAFEMIKHSINVHRGCFGGCSFCTISAHQGKFVSSRSTKSVIKELDKMVSLPDFKGYVTDIGGPSANMYKMQGEDLEICKPCRRPSCIFPDICYNLKTDHEPLLNMYREVRNHPKVKKATIGSGIRYDMLLEDNSKYKKSHEKYTEELITHHVSGRLKVAPEHTSDNVLKIMRKPSFDSFKKFKIIFDKINKQFGLNQQIIPYFISSHPASTEEEMAELAAIMKELGFKLEQVQDLTPTPMTVAAVIFYSGYHPYNLKKIYTPKSKQEKLAQRKYFFWYKNEYRKQIKHSLQKLDRLDLMKRLFSS